MKLEYILFDLTNLLGTKIETCWDVPLKILRIFSASEQKKVEYIEILGFFSF